jgi:hypothetical protein
MERSRGDEDKTGVQRAGKMRWVVPHRSHPRPRALQSGLKSFVQFLAESVLNLAGDLAQPSAGIQ